MPPPLAPGQRAPWQRGLVHVRGSTVPGSTTDPLAHDVGRLVGLARGDREQEVTVKHRLERRHRVLVGGPG
eukprot:scaffold71604_cov30-Phaeocystis_antarctica.AAC.1